MYLSVLERVIALSILPRQGDYAMLKIRNTLELSLAFTEEEIKAWGISSDPETGRTTWKDDVEAEIPIGEKATDIIVDALKKLNRDKKLPVEAMSLYEKFITIE